LARNREIFRHNRERFRPNREYILAIIPHLTDAARSRISWRDVYNRFKGLRSGAGKRRKEGLSPFPYCQAFWQLLLLARRQVKI
jgi:hypothetical protein